MRALLTLMFVLSSPVAAGKSNNPKPIRSLSTPIPDHLSAEFASLQKDFKNNHCRVPWNKVGPVRYSARRGRNKTIPGWEIGNKKKTVFVGYKNKNCDVSIFRAPVKSGDQRQFNQAMNTFYAAKSNGVNRSMNTAIWGYVLGIGGTATGIALGASGSAPIPVAVGTGVSSALTGTLMGYFGWRSAKKKAAVATLKKRRTQGKRLRKKVKPWVNDCLDSASPDRASCLSLVKYVRPDRWQYGKLSGKSPAEIAVRAKHQVRALDHSVKKERLRKVKAKERQLFAALGQGKLTEASTLASQINGELRSIGMGPTSKPSSSDCKLLNREAQKFFKTGQYGGLDASDYEKLNPLVSYVGRSDVCGSKSVDAVKTEVAEMDKIVQIAQNVKRKMRAEKKRRMLPGYYVCRSWDNSSWALTIESDGSFMSRGTGYWSTGSWDASEYSVTLYFERADMSTQALIGRSITYNIEGRSLVLTHRLGSTVCR